MPFSSRSHRRPTIVEIARSRMRMMRPSGAAAVLDALDADDDAVAVHRFVEMGPGM
jgi:hypothetical protein